MSDYTPITTFATKDGLSTGDPEKIISGADVDAEFSAIQTAVATKYDSADVASQAQAEAESSNSVLMTPLRVANWADANAGVVGDLQALASLATNGDKIFGFDDTSDTGIAFTPTDGITTSGTNLILASSTGGAGLTYTSGVLAVGAGSGITVNANDVQITDVSATTGQPIGISSGTFDFDITALTNREGNALAATDEFIFDNGGTAEAIAYQDMGFRVQTGETTQTLAASDMNTIMEFNTTATITLPLNSTTALPVGSCIIIVNDNASTNVTVTAATSVTLNSIFHAGGGSAASDKVLPGGTAVCIKTETNEWYLSGDIIDA